MIIIRKTVLAVTGLFICIFLIAHLGANFLLILPTETARALYNEYSNFLRHNILITIIAYINYACIIFHVIYGLLITIHNRRSKGPRPIKNSWIENSTWTSQNMGLLGTLLLAFIIVHMANFWFKVKFLHDEKDLYQMVITLLTNPWYVLFYTLAMLPLGLHLAHGIKSAFKSLGLYHKKYLRWVAVIAVSYAWVVGLGFAIIPLIIYFKQAAL